MADKQARKKADGKTSSRKKYVAVIGTVVIILIIAGALVYGLTSGSPTGFSTFRNHFNSASRVAIYATAYNGTAVSATVGCATAVIESVVESPQYHRNTSTIDLFLINQSTCVYENGIGGVVGNLTYNTIGNCINTSRVEPSIFINYSLVNSTLVKPTALYISGDTQFLALCGVASEIT